MSGISFKLNASIVVPAVVGLSAGFIGNKLGYDINALEGMKQALLTALPVHVLLSSNSSDVEMENMYANAKNHPCKFGAVYCGFFASAYLISSYAMESLSNNNLSNWLTAIVGGLDGLVNAAVKSIVGRTKY